MGRLCWHRRLPIPSSFYAVVISPSDTFTGLYKTVDGGNNWTLTTARTSAPRMFLRFLIYCGFFLSDRRFAHDANIVYAAGIYTFATNTSPGVATTVIGSTNGGATWTPVGSGTGTGHRSSYRRSCLAFSADATSFTPAVTAERGKTADSATPATLNWTGLNAGLSTAQFYPGLLMTAWAIPSEVHRTTVL